MKHPRPGRLDGLQNPGNGAFEVATPEGPVECLVACRGTRAYA